MFHQDYLKAIDLTAEIHKKLKDQVNLKIKDKKLAIYYLQGGCITQAYIALKEWAIGDLNAHSRAKRFIDEAKDLALYFSLLEDNDRHIQTWFQNEIVSVPNFTSPSTRVIRQKIIKKMKWNVEILEKHQNTKELIGHEFSKGIHPNLDAVIYNFNKETIEFNYTCEKLSYYPIRNFDFANFVIIPAMDSLLTNDDVLKLNLVDLAKLQEVRTHIQEIAKQLWAKRKGDS